MFECEPDFVVGFEDHDKMISTWKRLGPLTVEKASQHTNRKSDVLKDNVVQVGESLKIDLTKVEGTIRKQLERTTFDWNASESDAPEVDPFLKYDGYMRKFENSKGEQLMYEGQCKRGVRSGFGRQFCNKEVFIG